MAVWRTVLGINQCGINDNFFELGGDSFKAIRVARRIDERLPVVELFKNPAIRSLAAYLREGARASEDMLCLLTPRSRKASVSLVCIPYGGGNAASYHALANTVPTHFALWSLALPGHDHSETSKNLQTVEETAKRCCDEIVNRVTGPIVVYGQCAGASLAVELTRLLLQRGADVRAVYVGAALPDANPKASLQLERSSSDLQLQEYLKALGGFDGALDWIEVTDILKLVRHDLIQSSKFFETCYSAPPNLTAPLRCVIGDQDIATKGFESRFREWELFATDVELIVIPGAGHYFIKSNADELAALLARYHSNDPGYE